jgi:hypothetical protein
MVRRIRARLSYANVVATLALFAALGGASYAATQIDGHQIQEHSIPTNRLVRDADVPLADNVRHLVMPKRDTDPSGPDVIKLSFGQEAHALFVGPFNITARCSQKKKGPEIAFFATASAGKWYARSHTKYGPWSPHQAIKFGWIRVAPQQVPTMGTLGVYSLMTADGHITTVFPSVSFGLVSDCAFSMYAIT